MKDIENDSYEDEGQSLLAQINVTPLVDVTLVLLIIFMITAPLMQHGVKIQLPKATTKQLNTDESSLILTITKRRKLFINKFQFKMKNLSDKIKVIYENKSNKDIFIKADKKVQYGFVIEVMSELKKAGIDKIGLVTLPQ